MRSPGVTSFFLQRGGDGERLEGRARLVGEAGRPVDQVFVAGARRGRSGSTGGQLAIARICEVRGSIDDRRRALRRVRFADLGQHLLGLLLDRRVERQLDVFAVARLRCTVSSRIGSPSASLTIRRSPSVAAAAPLPRPPRARSGPGFRRRRRRSPAPPSRPAGRCGGCRAARRSRRARAVRSAPRSAGRPCGRRRRSRIRRSALSSTSLLAAGRGSAPASPPPARGFFTW